MNQKFIINKIRPNIKIKNVLYVLFALIVVSITSIYIHAVKADESVSAIVPPRVSDFQFNLSTLSPQPLSQNENITYQITYGSEPSAQFPSTDVIVASWANTKAPDNSQLLEYQLGSASTGYGGAEPVVDLVNKTITWTIIDIPAGMTDQTVTFVLRTITGYSKTTPFTFDVHASMSNQYVNLPILTLRLLYAYQAPITTPGPTAIPTITQTPTPTPTPQPIIIFTDVGINTLTDTKAGLQISTNLPTRLEIAYGTTESNLTNTVSTNTYSITHAIMLNHLAPDATYYFRVTAIGYDGQTANSDLFEIHTAKNSTIPNLDNNIIVISSNGSILESNSQKQNEIKNPFIYLISNSDYSITYSMTNPVKLKSIDLLLTKNVLGINTFSTNTEPVAYVFPMIPKSQTLYVATLHTLPVGYYTVTMRIIDEKGNIVEKPVGTLKIMQRLSVYAQDTNRPLQDARVYLYYYDTQTHNYQPITQELFGTISNPSFTNEYGQIATNLPSGNYRVDESALLYKNVTTDFTIGPGINQNFPVMYLKRDPFNVYALSNFIVNYLNDSWSHFQLSVAYASASIRIFHLISVVILGSFVLLCFILFLCRSQLHIKHLPVFLFFHIDMLLNQHQQKYIYGVIVNEFDKPISRALIEIEDSENKTILMQTKSNKSGRFYIRNKFGGSITILVIKEGFAPATILENKLSSIPPSGLQIKLENGTSQNISISTILYGGFEKFAGLLFEASLVVSIVLEIIFLSLYGFMNTIPYFILSLLNVCLWIFYLREKVIK